MPITNKEDTSHYRGVTLDDIDGSEEAPQFDDEPRSSKSTRSLMDDSISSKRSSQKDPLMMGDEADGLKKKSKKKRSSKKNPKGRSKKRFLVPALVVGAVVLLLVILLPVLLTRKNDDSKEAADGPLVPLPMLGVTLPPYTIAAVEADADSPQARAYEWMLDDPRLQFYSQEQRLQRFALATLFYSLNGPEWNTSSTLKQTTHTRDNGDVVEVSTTTTSTESWLSDKNECDWLSSTKTTTRIPENDDEPEPTKPDANDGGGRRRLKPIKNGGGRALKPVRGGSSPRRSRTQARGSAKDGPRRLRFTENKSLCGSSRTSSSTATLQSRGWNTGMRMMMTGNNWNTNNWNVQNMRMMMMMMMNGNGGNGNGNGNGNGDRDYYYYDSYDSYDWYSSSKSASGSYSKSASYSSSGSYDSYDSYDSWDYYYSRGKGGKGGYYDDYLYRNRALGQENSEDPQDVWEPVKHLHLPENNLVGTLPPELALLTAVESIDFRSNHLYGSLPTEIFGSMPRLTSLDLQDNFLTGALPTEIGLWSNNVQNHKDNALLEMEKDGGTSPLPKSSGMIVDFSGNYFNRTLPSELGQLTSLVKLNLGFNNFTGPMASSSFESLTDLHSLNLGENALTGPLWISPLLAMTKLQELFLHQNQLTGELPEEIGLLTSLRILELDNNGLHGTLPVQLRTLQKLDRLLLYNNVLEGSIPPQFGTMGRLRVLGLTSNQLALTIPSEMGLMTSLEHLWLYKNQLMGFIPTELGDLALNGNLKVLAVQENELIGVVPKPLCGLSIITFDCEEDMEERLLCGCNCSCSGEPESAATVTPPTQPPAVMDSKTGMPTVYRRPDTGVDSPPELGGDTPVPETTTTAGSDP